MTRVAIIGAGGMAREHIRAFQASGVSVTGICSRTLAKAEALATEFGINAVCDDAQTLRERSQAELVVVAVPELAANSIAKAVFRENWAVLLEKPAGYDLADAEDIVKAAAGRAAPVYVGFNRRFYSSVMTTLTDLDSRSEHRFVHVQDQQSFAEARRYNHPEPVVEKFMYANSIHVIDMLRVFCRGEVTSVNPVMPWQGAKTEVVLAHVKFDSGDAALYEGIWQGPGPWTCAVSTPNRRWMLQPLERASFQNLNERKVNPVEPDPVDVSHKAGFIRQAEAVLASMQGKQTRAVTLSEGLKTMKLINQIFGV